MKKLVLSLLLLVTATFMSGVFAQSAEEAAKYGQLQEIQLLKAGQLSKFIKKEDPNVKALKLSGEFNAKDWELLYSLPNIKYLDLQEVHNVATEYKYKDKSGTKCVIRIREGELCLFSSESLKFLAVPHNVNMVSLPKEPKYSLEMLVADSEIDFIEHILHRDQIDRHAKIKLLDVKISTSDTPIKGRNTISSYISSLGRERKYRDTYHLDCRTLYIAGNKQYCNCKELKPQEIVVESSGEKALNYYTGDSKIVNLNDYSMIIARAFEGKNIEEVNTGEKITDIPDNCFWGMLSMIVIH